jgi:hypothetical protein
MVAPSRRGGSRVSFACRFVSEPPLDALGVERNERLGFVVDDHERGCLLGDDGERRLAPAAPAFAISRRMDLTSLGIDEGALDFLE